MVYKIESIFKKVEGLGRNILRNRFLLYKIVSANVKLSLVFLILFSGATYAAVNALNTEYVELLVKTSDNILSKKPRSEWTEEMLKEERAGNGKQGYIMIVKPAGSSWGRLELDPKRYAIVKIPASEWNKEWLEPEYDYDNPEYNINEEGNSTDEIIGYPIKTQRKYRLPLESFLTKEELIELKSIPYNDATQREPIIKEVDDISEKIALNTYIDNPKDFFLHGSSGIFTICPIGCDYSTLYIWEDTEGTDISGTGTSTALIIEKGFEEEVWVQIWGWTTANSAPVIIKTTKAVRHKGVWDDSLYRIAVANNNALEILEDYVQADGLQLYAYGATGDDLADVLEVESGVNAASNIRLSNLIVRGENNDAYEQIGIDIRDEDANVYIWNILIYDMGQNNYSYGLYSNTPSYVHNVTIINNWAGLRGVDAGEMTAKNVLIKGSGYEDFWGGAGNSYINCASGDDTANDLGGDGNREYQTFTFKDEGNKDFRLASNDAGAKDYGADLSVDANLSFSDDIAGNPRTGTWDIGAFERPDELIGHWSFNEGYASTTYDGTGNNDGAMQDNTLWTDGLLGKALTFDGVNDFVSITHSAGLDFATSTNFTIALWTKHNGAIATNNDYLITKAAIIGDVGGYKLYMDFDGDFCFDIDDDGVWDPDDSACATNNNYDDSLWHHVTAVKDTAEGLRLFVDAQEVASDISLVATGSLQNGNDFYIGIDTDGTSNPWQGLIDDVQLYNYSLSAEQVRAAFNAVGGGGMAKVSVLNQTANTGAAPVGWWKFETQSGATAYDSSGNLNDGTLTAGPVWRALGKVGGAVQFDGSDDYINIGDTDQTVNTVAFWLKANDTSKDIIDFDGGTHSIEVGSGTITATGWSSPTIYVDGLYGSTITVNNWHHVTATTSTGFEANNLQIGTETSFFDGLIDEVKIYDYVRNMRQIMIDYNNGGPMGYWKFDEGYASTTEDISGYDNDGALQDNTLWTMNGKHNKALDFDGTNDYVSVADDASLDFDTDDFTIELWANHDGAISAIDYLLTKADTITGGYKLWMDASGDFCFGVDDDGTWTPDDSVCTLGVDYDDSNWHHVAGAKAGVSRIELYIDGQKLESKTSLIASATLTNSNALYIGIDRDGSSNPWDGRIDEVKVYNYMRTPQEIREDYASGASAKGRGAALKLAAPKNSVSVWDDGGFGGAAPVGWWKFETQSGATAYDSSGNLNDGTLTAGPVWRALGKVGGGIDFDGADDYINIGDTNQTVNTVSFWLKADNTSKDIIDFDGGTHSIEVGSGTITATGWSSPTIYVDGLYGSTITVNNWHHVTATTSTGFEANNLQIGTETSFFGGLLDEVKIYNYIRSQAQIAYDYNGGKPVGHWKFDEKDGYYAYDASGNDKKGIVYPGSGGANTATSTMWNSGGKINYAIDFDGTDDYIDVGDINANISAVSFWIYADANNVDIIDFDGGTHSVEITSANAITATGWSSPSFYINGELSSSATAGAGAWYHIVVTTATEFSVSNLQIGTETSYFNGKIDDLRIYNYPRSAEQVRQDYNSGAGVRF